MQYSLLSFIFRQLSDTSLIFRIVQLYLVVFMKITSFLREFITVLSICVLSGVNAFAQTDPVIYFSRNTISSVLQDQLIKNISGSSLPKYIFNAPSYCYQSDNIVHFTEIISATKIDFEKISVLTYCDSLATLKTTLDNLGCKNFIVLNGTLAIGNDEISTNIGGAIGSTNALNQIAIQIATKKTISTISPKDMSIYYDQAKFEHLKLNPKFTVDGLIIGQNNPTLALIGQEDLTNLNRELQSTGVTSTGVVLPLDFVNQQFAAKPIPYNDGKGTNILLNNSKFSYNDNTLKFETTLSGSSLQNKPIKNTYLVTAIFNPADMTLISFKSQVASGADTQESSLVRVIVNLYENMYRGKLIFTIPNDKNYNVKGNNSDLKVNVSTYYGHFINGLFVFVNSFNLKK